MRKGLEQRPWSLLQLLVQAPIAQRPEEQWASVSTRALLIKQPASQGLKSDTMVPSAG